MDAPRWAVEYVELTMSPSYPLSWAAIGGNGSVFVPEDPPAADFDLDLGIEKSDDFEMKSHRIALKLNPRFLDIWTFKDIWIFEFGGFINSPMGFQDLENSIFPKDMIVHDVRGADPNKVGMWTKKEPMHWQSGNNWNKV